MILSDCRGPGAHFGGLETHFEDISDFCDFGDAPATKGESFLGAKLSKNQLSTVLLFVMFFECSFFLFLYGARYTSVWRYQS